MDADTVYVVLDLAPNVETGIFVVLWGAAVVVGLAIMLRPGR